jgi:hypothetical protein
VHDRRRVALNFVDAQEERREGRIQSRCCHDLIRCEKIKELEELEVAP